MTERPFTAALFDMDGVLIQSRSVIESAWTHVARRYGIAVSEAFIRDHIHGRSGEYTLEVMFNGIDLAKRRRIKKEVDAIEEAGHCALVPGVIKLIAQLHNNAVPMALVTSSWIKRVEYVLQQHNLENVFDCIITREDVNCCKPAPDCYLLAAQRLNRSSHECLVFEDAVSGVQAAVQSGALCLGIGNDLSLEAWGAAATFVDFNALPISFTSALIHLFDGSALLIGTRASNA